jgi:hypothetical protein
MGLKVRTRLYEMTEQHVYVFPSRLSTTCGRTILTMKFQFPTVVSWTIQYLYVLKSNFSLWSGTLQSKTTCPQCRRATGFVGVLTQWWATISPSLAPPKMPMPSFKPERVFLVSNLSFFTQREHSPSTQAEKAIEILNSVFELTRFPL